MKRACIGLGFLWVLGCGSSAPPTEVPIAARGGTPLEVDARRAAPAAADAHAAAHETDATSPAEAASDPVLRAEVVATRPGAPRAEPRLRPEVVAHVREIASRRRRNEHVFIKVGDSATVNRAFMQCFADDDEVALGRADELRPLIERVRAARVRGTSSFARESRAAGVGWSVYRAISGSSSAVAREVRAMSPRYALVMFGGNDVETGALSRYRRRMEDLVERLTSWGVVPILSTIPPRNDDPEADAQVPRFNAALRELAARRRLPLVDLHAAMLELPQRGLASDGVHPSAPVRDGRARGCDLTSAGLVHGQNLRNLLNLQMLEALEGALAAPAG